MNRRRLLSASSPRSESDRSCSLSVVRQKTITPTHAASTATPWISDQVHGCACPDACWKIRPGKAQEPTPWLRIVKTTFTRNGTQSW